MTVRTSLQETAAYRSDLRGHRLERLWRKLEELVPLLRRAAVNVANTLQVDLSAPDLSLDCTSYEAAVNELMRTDPDGQMLRYASSVQGVRNMSAVHSVDLAKLNADFVVLYQYLHYLSRLATTLHGYERSTREMAHHENRTY